MAYSSPFNQITGALKAYIADYGTAEPNINQDPTSVPAWVSLGTTDGDQSIEISGALTFFRDNDHTGPTKTVREEEDVAITLTIVDSTHAIISRALSDVGKITTGTMNGANISRMPLKRGAQQKAYALLLRGAYDSPYGQFPGQYYVPLVVSDSEPSPTRGKGNRQEWEVKFNALEDDAQSNEDMRLGWQTVQIS